MKQLILILVTIFMATGCLTLKLKECIEKEDVRTYKLNTLNELKGGFNSEGELVIHNFQKVEPKNFCIEKEKGKYTYHLNSNANTFIERTIPTLNLNETVIDQKEYLRITKKTDYIVTFSLKEKGRPPRTIKAHLDYKVSANTSKRFGLKLLYPFAIIGDAAIIVAFLYIQSL